MRQESPQNGRPREWVHSPLVYCYSFLQKGHVTLQCQSTVFRSGKCISCEVRGYDSRKCTAETNCLWEPRGPRFPQAGQQVPLSNELSNRRGRTEESRKSQSQSRRFQLRQQWRNGQLPRKHLTKSRQHRYVHSKSQATPNRPWILANQRDSGKMNKLPHGQTKPATSTKEEN